MVDYPPVVLNWGHFKTYIMKVICIDETTPGKLPKSMCELKEGEIYTVKSEDISPISGIPTYWFVELILAYGKYRFIPLSEVDETEFERNYNLQPCAS